MALSDPSAQFDSRVDRLEQQVEGIATSVSELASEQRANNATLTANITSIAGSVRELTNQTRELSRPKDMNWGWVLGAVTALGGFIMLYTRPLEIGSDQTSRRLEIFEDRAYEEAVRDAEWRGRVNARLGIESRATAGGS